MMQSGLRIKKRHRQKRIDGIWNFASWTAAVWLMISYLEIIGKQCSQVGLSDYNFFVVLVDILKNVL